MNFNLGKGFYWFNRMWGHLGKVMSVTSFLGVVYLTTATTPIFLYVIPIALIIGLGFGTYDIIKIVPQEATYTFSKSPPFTQMQKRINKILEILEKQEVKK